MTVHNFEIPPQQTLDENPAELISYKDAGVTFAVDVSASTGQGEILEAEKDGVKSLCRYLSTQARAWSRILPWNSRQHIPIPLAQVDELYPSGGTNPTVLTYPNIVNTRLQECSLWFLFTDGYINERAVRSFATGIGRQGLHGKACVIILYGNSEHDRNPYECNISVGQAVFAIAPDCAFLFYDVAKRDLVVFQCKGCFRKILPKEDMEITLSNTTTWDELPRTSYEELAKISVPRPRQVDLNNVILSNGHIISLDDLFKDSLSHSVISKIFGNDDDLKTILLTAQTRGMSRGVEQWISRQRLARGVAEDLRVPDVDGKAFHLVGKIVDVMRAGDGNPDEINKIRKRLRDAHTRNSLAYVQSVRSAEQSRSERNTVVEHALARVKLNRESPGSPGTMSPVTPRQRPQQPSQYTPFTSPPSTGYGQQYIPYQPSPQPERTSPEAMYTKGYSLGSGSFACERHCDECSLCEDITSPLALILKAKPDDFSTEGDFPEARSYQQVIFPLAMGNFPETDVISSFVCCERCAYFIRKVGYSPTDDKVTGYIPLVSSKLPGNRSSKLLALDIALEGRFDHSILEQIFLSILYSKLDEVLEERNANSKPLLDALRWECSNVAAQVTIPETISASFELNSPVSVGPLLPTLCEAFRSQRHGCSKLVTYPVDGFVTLMRIATNAKSNVVSEDMVCEAVIQRFMYHLLEQQCSARREDGPEAASEELRRILVGDIGGIDRGFFSADVETIVGTYLLDEDTLDTFSKLGAPFRKLEREGGVAVRQFLQVLAELPWEEEENKEKSPPELFDMLIKDHNLDTLFGRPFQLKASDFSQYVDIGEYVDYAQYLEQDTAMTDQVGTGQSVEVNIE